MPSSVYQRKLYALLQTQHHAEWLNQLACFQDENGSNTALLHELDQWWNASSNPLSQTTTGKQIQNIASSSDRVNLQSQADTSSNQIRHPISGQSGTVQSLPPHPDTLPETIHHETDAKKVFWWFWRFYPELWLNPQSDSLSDDPDGLLYPAHPVLPDCPLHSYQATVSALTGALFPDGWNTKEPNAHPYLLIFTFSPIQDFIKASRKFLDFWAGSYLLHYLSARLCWHIANEYGPDAVIVPSLWGQDIFDAFWLEQTQTSDPEFWQCLQSSFQKIGDRKTPVDRFNDKSSTSLSTAGFPNVITVLVPGLDEAKKLGKQLAQKLGNKPDDEPDDESKADNQSKKDNGLKNEWVEIGNKVRDHIRDRVSQEAANILDNEKQWNEFWTELKRGLPGDVSSEPYKSDLQKWRSQCNQRNELTYPNWEWNELWKQQLENTWEPYWSAVPLGNPTLPLTVCKTDQAFKDWKTAQARLSQSWLQIPSRAEEHAFATLNVGTWWGSFQQRLRIAIQSVKNTRTWAIPVAPGERSTISGQYSAVHPNLNYRVVQRHGKTLDFREGGGVPAGSMRLFWLLMAKAYPGLFSGSEHLNALELTKRMAWIYGDVAEALGINVSQVTKRIQKHKALIDQTEQKWGVQHLEQFLYDRFVRFPNLSSIAAARFIHNHPEQVQDYCTELENAIAAPFGSRYQRLFRRVAQIRPSHIPRTDQHINPSQRKRDYLNGVMFSSKWLAEDLGLDLPQTQTLRALVEQVHKRHNFGEGSPSDWWAIVLADGDGMGQYISGTKLENYEKYLVDVDTSNFSDEIAEDYRKLCEETQKRMGPATHVGLNRALLDFSNRLVPYLTEKRFCGKAIYSGGDDVMAVLPLKDLPGYLRSLRAAWSGTADPNDEFDHGDGYWRPKFGPCPEGLPNRPLFTMGNTATLSMGVVIAYKTVPLPTVLESLWSAESDRAKEMHGKDGICFRVIYGGGNTLEALMKGHLLEPWWNIVQHYADELSPLLYRLADELPRRVDVNHPELFPLAAQVIMNRRDDDRKMADIEAPIRAWLEAWAEWAQFAAESEPNKPGATSDDLGYLLRFTAFWVDKMVQRRRWAQSSNTDSDSQPQSDNREVGNAVV